ncbi:polymer-forming cytoskeletal protein [Paenibacillus sp. FSL R5-0407]|uniref:bactofilin family protein n=1 Tax=Paenibacillus TaxID=44249 RepID=UPI0025B6314C|nr:polymer-forming cytoskeletal protein [Paenibacillus vini]MDN4070607.1 polymer-forming cytoskeletal protein [Paenibacillus vini]
MFKNKTAVKLDPNTTDTLVGEGSTFEGKIISGASIRIEGQVIGDIDCEGDVTVGEKGMIRSDTIIARNIIIAGTVNGNVQAKQKLTITAKGKLYGNLSAASLSIEEGSVFEGTSRMEGAQNSSSASVQTITLADKQSAAAAEK